MNSSKRIAPAGSDDRRAERSSEAEGTGELGDARRSAMTPGSTPNTNVATPVIAERGLDRARHPHRGDVAVGHRLHPHLAHDRDVVRRGDHGVDRADDGDAVAPAAAARRAPH